MSDTLGALLDAQAPIRAVFESWLADGEVDADQLAALHRRAAVAAHRHYVATVPAYRRLGEQLDLLNTDDPEMIWSELASTDELFKSYDPAWLDSGDFTSMSRWLAEVYNGPIVPEARSATSIEGWIAALAAGGTRVRFSSGTSGHFSFVARDERTDAALLGHSVKQVMASLEGASSGEHSGVQLADYDAVLLAFRGGSQGFAALAEQLGRIARSQTFLFDTPIDADLLRANIRGTANPGQEQRYAEFRSETVDRLDEHLGRIDASLAASVAAGNPTLVYAPPFQLLDLIERIDTGGRDASLPPGSMLMLGGGWKSFENARVTREELLGRVERTLGITSERITEGYGMSECNVVSNLCAHGHFHIPPVVHPMVYDDALLPTAVPGRGRYGFSDPFASCYPGFAISGDEVELTDEPCGCGRQGFSIIGEVSRAAGHEVKGCGGVMASVRM